MVSYDEYSNQIDEQCIVHTTKHRDNPEPPTYIVCPVMPNAIKPSLERTLRLVRLVRGNTVYLFDSFVD